MVRYHCTGPASCTLNRGSWAKGQVEAEMQPTLNLPSHILGRGVASASGKVPLPNVPKVLCGLVETMKPGLLMYTECEQSILGSVPWYTTGVQNTDSFSVWCC